MKKILYFIIAVLILVPSTVFADQVVCKSATLTCTFDTNGAFDCKNNDGSKHNYTAGNYNTHDVGTDFVSFSAAIDNYRALNDVAQGKCPPYVIIDSHYGAIYNTGNLEFLPTPPYVFEEEHDGVRVTHTYQPEDMKQWYMKIMNVSKKVTLETFSLESSNVVESCDSTVQKALNDLNEIDSKFETAGCYDNLTSNTSTSCDDYYAELKKRYESSNEVYNKYKNDITCDENILSSLNVQLTYAKTHMKYYNEHTDVEKKSTTTKAPSSKDGCPLGEEVTKDLSGALRVMKIMAPIFVLVYTIYDAIVAIVNGDVQAEGKKMLSKFLKRLAAAITLFAIPVLIDVWMQLFNIWDSSGHCSFVDVVDSDTSGKTTDHVSGCLNACDNAGSATAIEACKKKCTTTTTTSCEQKCQAIPDKTGRDKCIAECNN